MKNDLKIIAKQLIQKSKEQGLSQREWARRSGVAQKTISRIENEIDVPSYETLEKLAKILHLKLQFSISLVEDDEKENQ